MKTYKITGPHAVRIAARDGVTLFPDGPDILVKPMGWTGDAGGARVDDYFDVTGYRGPDEDGLEPTWEDA